MNDTTQPTKGDAVKKILALILGLCLIVPVISIAGCVGGGNSQPSNNEKPSTIIIRTTGATFPKYQIQKWIEDYQKTHPNVKIEYEGGGSGYGQEAFAKGLTDIGRTDPPVKESMWKKFLSTGDQPLQFPEIVGAVVVTYNIPEIGDKTLKLSRDVLADIFLGKIEYWDDERIKKINPEIADKLPHEKIIVVHRSDASGTTAIFTTYLSLISKEWAEKVGAGKTVNWPTDNIGRGVAGKGNPGVVAIVKSTPYTVAYTELSYAIEQKLPVAALENKNGKFVKPTDETIKAAVSAVKASIPNPTEGYKEDLKQMLDAPGDNAYPIVAFTHLLVWENKNGKHYSPEKAKAIKDFLTWVLTEGQKPEHLAPGYVGLPEDVAKIGLNAVNMIKE
ncbi:periplasmic phosphate-binding protein (pstS) [Methanocaldococcus jannaschii DSM 2661]|uniref:Phosphate-binding protein PstS n=1 Tax=Methanocaldococcus jannaschii (strain ATCC 43067 / DSM 2661 / JAL-1 / JCM 10045 / NBRC 100440) TaxID=243232 RepID=PSTS_METJA|nr:RecName: Full=Phosphate-binding protein PstS; Short=PBP [Methanocaldococcus jannaschii DSM 2661]AAB99019.1 periplasmic phosphate-binding protein (pstS) [Methanocaldococcus jannaschii DSM 2661]